MHFTYFSEIHFGMHDIIAMVWCCCFCCDAAAAASIMLQAVFSKHQAEIVRLFVALNDRSRAGPHLEQVGSGTVNNIAALSI